MTERVLDHLEGYSHSRPVRTGNGAADQPQWDIYGEVLESAYLLHKAGGVIEPELWSLLRELVKLAAARWKEPDRSFWEIWEEGRHFTFSKLMCWGALDRGLKLARAPGLRFQKLGTDAEANKDEHLRGGLERGGRGIHYVLWLLLQLRRGARVSRPTGSEEIKLLFLVSI